MRIPIAKLPFEEALPRLIGIDIFRDFSEDVQGVVRQMQRRDIR